MIKKLKKTILFLGEIPSFYEELEKYSSETISTDYELFNFDLNPGNLLEQCTQKLPHIVFLDFTTLQEEDITPIAKEVRYLKRNPEFKTVLIVAILSNSEQMTEYEALFTSGIQFAQVKGVEFKKILTDSFYIGLDEKVELPQYALAQSLSYDMNVGIFSSIGSFNADELMVETDYDKDVDHISLNVPFFESTHPKDFKVIRHHEMAFNFSLTDSYKLEFPYLAPWEVTNDESVQKDTVETWIGLHEEDLKNYLNIKVVSKSSNLMKDIFLHSLGRSLSVQFVHEYNNEKFEQEVYEKKPEILFFDIVKENDEDKGIDQVGEAICKIIEAVEEEPKPFIVITGCSSSAEALQKAFGYQNLIATARPLSIDIYTGLVDKFISTNGEEALIDTDYVFNILDKRRIVLINHEVELTSISEHEVTFFSEDKLPMFSVIKFKIPMEFYVTIIPPTRSLKYSTKGVHHMGLIYGLDEIDLKQLRYLVNQIIYNRPEVLNRITIDSLLIREKESIESKLNEEKKSEQTDLEDKRYEIVRKPPYKGKSKL